jgi:hypothetical protein
MNVQARAFVVAEKQAGSNVAKACTLLKVSRSAFYASLDQPACERVCRDGELTDMIAVCHRASRGTYGAERLGVAGVEVESAGGVEGAGGEQGDRQDAAYTPGGGFGSEEGPAVVACEVVGVEGQVLGDGVDAGTFVAVVLERVEGGGDGVGVSGSGGRVAVEEHDAGEVAAFDGGTGQGEDLGQGVVHAAGGE